MPTATVATTQSEEKTQGTPTVVSLSSIAPLDVKAQVLQIDTWLQGATGKNLKHIQHGASIPMVANIFALTGSVLDLIAVSKSAAKPGSNPLGYGYLALNLIGLLPSPTDEAHARMALRPILALAMEHLAKSGKIPDSAIQSMINHLNDKVAGDISLLLKGAKTRIQGALLSEAAGMGQLLASDMAKRIAVAQEGTLTQAYDAIADTFGNLMGQTALVRDPAKTFNNWGKTLHSLLDSPETAPATPAANGTIDIVANLNATAAMLSTELLKQKSGKHTLGEALDTLIQAVDAYKKKGDTAAVPVSTTGLYDREVKGATLEFVSLQAAAIACPGCDAAPSGTASSIGFALGNERISHSDYVTTGLFPIIGSRLYASDLDALDHSEFGARWITPYTTRIIEQRGQLRYIGADGRSHRYPVLKAGEIHYDPIEKLTISRISPTMIAMTRGKDWVETYEQPKTGGQTYRLTMMNDTKNQQTVGLRYDHSSADGRSVLSDIITKKHETILSHVGTQINTSGQITALWEIKDGKLLKQLAHYRYNPLNQLILAQDENAQHWTYEYNPHHQLTRYTDRTGRGQNIRYDGTSPNSKAYHEWSDDGSFETRLKWDEHVRKVTVTDAVGAATEYHYDLLGYTTRIVYANGLEEWFHRDSRKNITQHVHANGSISSNTFDANDHLLTSTHPDGGKTRFQYDEQEQLTAIRDPEGGIWQRDYDERGNLIEQIDPLGRSTTYEYNALGLPILITDAKGGNKQITYTADGQMASFTDCSGKTSTWTYDAQSRLIKQTNAAGQTTQYTYSDTGAERGQLKHITHADGQVETLQHDAEGRLLSHTDPRGNRTVYQYTHAGLIANRTDAAGHTIAYNWDKAGKLSALINANQASYRFNYNLVGQLTSETGFDSKQTHYHYDPTNGLLQHIEDDSLSTAVVFDDMGRIIERSVVHQQTQAKQSEQFNYDLNGQLIQARNHASQLNWYYDLAGQLVREHQQYPQIGHSQPATAIWQHQYDALGNRTTTIRPDGHRIELMTYGSGHVHGVLLDQVEAIAFERDDLHRETVRTQANHLSQTLSYDAAGRLKQQLIAYAERNSNTHSNHPSNPPTGVLNTRNYSYDAVGQLTHINDGRRGALDYQYDPVGRLLQANSSLGQELFAFDPAGNIAPVAASTANEHPNQPHQATENHSSAQQSANKVLDNLLKDYIGTHYEYDARGNMVKRIHNGQTTTFVWDNFNRMVQSNSQDVRTTYVYDALGRRIMKHSEPIFSATGDAGSGFEAIQKSKIRREKNLGLIIYGWDGDTLAWESNFGSHTDINHQTGQIEAAFDNSRTTHYIYEPNSFVPMIQASRQGRIQLLPTPDYDRFRRGEAQYDIDQDPVWHYQAKAQPFDAVAFYQCDHLGTPQELTDMNGEIAWAAEYKAWGHAYDALSKAGRQAGLKQPLRFQGQYYDHETGLHYNRHRYYDPHSGRFVSKDPIGLKGGINVHAYATNPTAWVDPMGLSPDNIGDTSVCTYYDAQMKNYPTCTYYKNAGDICKGNNSLVNKVVDAAMWSGRRAAQKNGKTNFLANKGNTLTEIRNGLVDEDWAAREAGKVDPTNNCVRGNEIDAYHERVFNRVGLSSRFYGGNLWFQGVAPNPVPLDPSASKYDPRRLWK